MAISIQCPDCEKKLKAKDELAGKRVKCPACGQLISVPNDQALAAGKPARPSPGKSSVARKAASTAVNASERGAPRFSQETTFSFEVMRLGDPQDLWTCSVHPDIICFCKKGSDEHAFEVDRHQIQMDLQPAFSMGTKPKTHVLFALKREEELWYMRSYRALLTQDAKERLNDFAPIEAAPKGALMVVGPFIVAIVAFVVLPFAVIAPVGAYFENAERARQNNVVVLGCVLTVSLMLGGFVLFRWSKRLASVFAIAARKNVHLFQGSAPILSDAKGLEVRMVQCLSYGSWVYYVPKFLVPLAVFCFVGAIVAGFQGHGARTETYANVFAVAVLLLIVSVVLGSIVPIVASFRCYLPALLADPEFRPLRLSTGRLLLLEEFLAWVVLAPLLTLGGALATLETKRAPSGAGLTNG